MAVDLARVPVASPAFVPLSYGLLSASSLPSDGIDRIGHGIDFTPDSCAEASTTTSPCPSPGTITKAPTVTGIGTYGAEAFTVYAEIQCGPVGLQDGELRARTAALLTNGEGRAIENTFWTGAAGAATIRPHLAEDTAVIDTRGLTIQTAATVVTGASMNVIRAIGLLEGMLADCYGGEGVIHVPRMALAHLDAAQLVHKDGQRLRTIGGNIIAAYASNNRQGPAGTNPAAPNDVWFYATGAVDIRRSDIMWIGAEVAAGLNRSENMNVLIAERTYVINWACCHYAQQVTLT